MLVSVFAASSHFPVFFLGPDYATFYPMTLSLECYNLSAALKYRTAVLGGAYYAPLTRNVCLSRVFALHVLFRNNNNNNNNNLPRRNDLSRHLILGAQRYVNLCLSEPDENALKPL